MAGETLSAGEERFERGRRTAGFVLGPLVFLVVLLAPLDLEQNQHTLAAILGFVVVMWICETLPLPVTGLVGIVLCAVLGVAPVDDVFAPFGSSTIFLFIGAFILGMSMLANGLARRFAYRILAIPSVGKSTVRTIVAFGLITAALSAFISNSATVAMLLPTAVAILGAVTGAMEGDQKPHNMRVSIALLLMLAYGASVGGLLTPVGSPPNIIGRGLIEDATDTTISFLEWVVMALPICAVMFVILALLLVRLNKPEVRRLEALESHVREEREKLGPLSVAERNTLIAFAVAVVGWIGPGVVGIVAGDTSSTYEWTVDHFDEGVVAMAAASLLFLLPTDWRKREFTLTWEEAARIDWGTIILFGSGIIFGSLLADTGLAETIGTSIADAFGVSSTLAITIFAVVLSILISETTSNTASASIAVPIVLPIATAAEVNPIIPGMAAVFAASFGFMLPVSTPQNAIVYGSGMVPITKMVRSGIVFDVLGAIVIIVAVPIMLNVVGIT
jgi:solute carrier family 13 (sodium-dependent dicarboxylate transporter), member 2/3/5